MRWREAHGLPEEMVHWSMVQVAEQVGLPSAVPWLGDVNLKCEHLVWLFFIIVFVTSIATAFFGATFLLLYIHNPTLRNPTLSTTQMLTQLNRIDQDVLTVSKNSAATEPEKRQAWPTFLA